MKLVITKLFGRRMDEVSRVSTFNWSPAASYLAGKRHKGKKVEAGISEDMKKPKT